MAITKEKELLIERAKLLQIEIKKENTNSLNLINVVRFKLSEEEFAIESDYINQVATINNVITPLPGVPDFIKGIINVRGKILSVIDLRSFLDLPITKDKHNQLILVEYNEIELAILADKITGNDQINPDTLKNNLPGTSAHIKKLIQGVTNDRLIVIDIKQLLQDKNIIVNENI